ncbi:2-succinyl-5-enolpyruvyl-6-hydroxy-3-cyclohexene-1-carboxylic-acid synthase [Salinibacterium sp. SYSU T00001]|uniref:2-succinyl-5-enolpyruvyl-6-hydroxy-3- cyclohexene-1-carboxylic-acid synthase n=1 Tax=Homoserinimonas sedimenticola TaxID=2986805 RepID=UPI00223683A5|nr:2-succinyl-5-enolpyruvyl-6-hydroxy-3-cyclohexene-1-carboxylic-acid synthase [Salinibacterium sedimenticola]MCW4385967.1 2-succinyl-5-enolpyruvyl-6-hydroxy-3-cyclohexene-1-carboxylic-acid synthase [Salinibacterium sedimenticola]
MSSGSPATEFSIGLLAELLRLGVRHLVVCPGSRSQALALAAAEFERADRARLHVRIDERSAGFLALGLAAESGHPAVVVTTSGTAVANLHPAVLEAHHAGVPLIVITGDRPPELRGIGSNQTTVQHGIFGAAVRFTRDIDAPSTESSIGDSGPERIAREAWSAASGHSGVTRPDAPGPVHLNVAFREPLSAAIAALPAVAGGASPLTTEGRHRAPLTLCAAPHTVVIAGDRAGEEAEATARALGAPLLAEVSSGARFGPNLVAAYRELLRDEEFGGRVERAIVFGHPTLSREVPALLRRDGVHTVIVRGRGPEDYNPGRRAAEFADAVEVEGPPDADRSWVGRWVHTSRALVEASDDAPVINAPDAVDGSISAEFQRQTLAALRAPVTRRALVDAVWRATWPHDRLVLGSSRLIREVDRVVPGKKIRVIANRGLAGIDGTVSTAVGVALASQDGADVAGTTRVLMGDLTLLHEPGGLLLGNGEARPRIQLIVGNDGGGTIFDGLEVAATSDPAAFERVMTTPHEVEFASLAAAYGWEYVRATTRQELDAALTGSPGPVIVEVPLPR